MVKDCMDGFKKTKGILSNNLNHFQRSKLLCSYTSRGRGLVGKFNISRIKYRRLVEDG